MPDEEDTGRVTVSVFDLFSIGIGPSSSHTVGPMRAARRFVEALATDHLLDRTVRIKAQLFGSLGATGHGHGSDKAVLWGLEGADPETIDTRLGPFRIAEIAESARIRLNGTHQIGIHLDNDVILHRRLRLPYHPNGMTFAAYDGDDELLRESTYYSIGGGFIVAADADGHPVVVPDEEERPAGRLFSRGRRTEPEPDAEAESDPVAAGNEPPEPKQD